MNPNRFALSSVEQSTNQRSLQVLACFEAPKVCLYFGGSIAGDLLLFAHKKSTNAGLDFGRTLIALLDVFRTAFAGQHCRRRRRCVCVASDANAADAAAGVSADVFDLFAHPIAAKVGLNFGGSALLRYGRVGRARMDMHGELLVFHVNARYARLKSYTASSFARSMGERLAVASSKFTIESLFTIESHAPSRKRFVGDRAHAKIGRKNRHYFTAVRMLRCVVLLFVARAAGYPV